jgi:hypothetical protein
MRWLPADDQPPYAAAALVTGLVLLGYILTLAPTVTFWDAGEFIAAAKILGIPHPPGTPLFVMIAHVWAMLLPIKEYAVRTNLLSASLSAAGAGCFFLVVHATLRKMDADRDSPLLAVGGAAAAAILGAFTFTNWQNSNETEVYAIATFTIAAMSWLVHVWRAARGTPRAPRLLLLIVYLAGVSIGNHLLALLAGPGIILFVVVTLLREPAPDSLQRRAEWGQAAVMAGVWALLIGTGLGSSSLTTLGGLCFLGAAIFAFTGGAGAFAVLALLIACIGVTPYLYVYIRSVQHPIINEAAPLIEDAKHRLDALLAVIRRAQYPPRTPLDDPTVSHGPNNPGRSLTILGIQAADYIVYFTWQWAKSAGAWLQLLVTLVFTALGIRGTLAQWRTDRAAWWLLAGLFLVTGPGLVIYMNFKPGFGRWFNTYPSGAAHEVRERDYFFVVSFIVWGLWAGIGLVTVARAFLQQGRQRFIPALPFALTLVPVALNWNAASRRGGPDALLAADFAYDLLNTAPPYGVLFTYGDNDTFPLWWGQEVAGIRRDVTVICLALANTDWYIRQMRENPVRSVDRKTLPPIWQGAVRPIPTQPLHAMTDAMIQTAMSGYMVPEDQQVTLGPLTRTLKKGSYLLPNDILTLGVIQQNIGRRPIVWAITTGREYAGLDRYVVQQGLGYALRTAPPDTTSPALDIRRLAGAPLDIPTTEQLVWDTYRYGDLLRGDATKLETTSASIASTLSLPFTQLTYAYSARGQREKMLRAMERAMQLSPNPSLRTALAELRVQGGAESPGSTGDTANK